MVTWEEFQEAVQTTRSHTRTATPTSLDAFERKVGFHFPTRYREFALTFGAGMFFFEHGRKQLFSFKRARKQLGVHLFIPHGPNTHRFYPNELEELNRAAGRPARAGRGAGNDAKQRSMLFFASGSTPNDPASSRDDVTSYGWALDEATDPTRHEYAIYRLRKTATAPERVAATFEEFLLDYCLGPALTAWVAAGHPRDRDIPADPYDRANQEVPAERVGFQPDFDHTDDRLWREVDPEAEAAPANEELVEVIHRIITAPVRGEADDETMYWTEVLPDDTTAMQFWTPEGEADRDRLDAFWLACQQVNWDDNQVHEVTALQVKRGEELSTPLAAPAAPAPPVSPVPPRAERPAAEFTEAGLIRRSPRPPAPVAESWGRIEAWAAQHCPEVVEALRPGASAAELAKLEQAIGQQLPADLRASLQIHDGLGWVPEAYADQIRGDDDDAPNPAFVRTVLYGYDLDPIVKSGRDQSILEHWEFWAEAADEQPEDGDEYGNAESFPAGAIRIRRACRGWIPLGDDGGNNCNYIGVDLSPGPTGAAGQVINFGRDEDQKFVLATSWGQFLEDYADELEAGNFEIDEPEGDDCRYLGMKQLERGQRGTFGRRYWSEAKLSAEFLAAEAPAPPELVPADPETDRACRAVVAGFIADQHAWRTRWRQIRPIAEWGFSQIRESPHGVFSGSPRSAGWFGERALPTPEPNRFAHSRAWHDPVKQARFWRDLGLVPRYSEAKAEEAAIFARFTTAGVQRHRLDFARRQVSRFEVDGLLPYDPAAQHPTAVLLRDPDTALVDVAAATRELTARFVLKREGDAWRIESRLFARENGEFVSEPL